MQISRRISGFVQSDIRAMTRECTRVGGINLGQGICDLPTPPLVRDAAIVAIRANESVYTYPEGLAALRAAIQAKLARENGIEADEQEIVVTTGSAGAFACALHALFDVGDGLLVLEPFYGYHVGAAKLAGLEPQCARLEAPGFRLTEEVLRCGLRANTRGLVLCTPGNPSGRMLDAEEIEVVARLAEERDLIVLTDEIYEFIRYDGRAHLSPAAHPLLRPRCVTIMGLSKTFSITGWRLGYAVAPAEWARAMTLVHDLYYICAPTPLQHGVTAGFASPPAFFEQMRASYADKRTRIVDALTRAGLTPIVPEGAYYVLADGRRLEGADARENALRLLERTKVAAVPGSAFYSQGGGQELLRFCFAKDDESLAEACRRLEAL